MANVREELVNRFIVLPKEGIVQSAWDVPIANDDLTIRLKTQIATSLDVDRREVRDCRDEDLTDRIIRTRRRRLTLTITEVDSQILAYFTAWFLGTAAAPTGTPANEVQTITDGGTDGTLAMTLEGRTVTTQTIPTGSTAAQIQAYLTAARMLFIQPGDVVITGASTPFTATFPDTGRLGRANLPTMVGTGGFSVAAGTNGAQNFHALTRATARTKQYISFCMGWEDDADRVEKYINYVVESLNVTASLDGDVQLVVNMVGMWDYDSIETTFTIPDCALVTPMPTSDVRLSINSVWQTTDINNLSATVNDNIPLDRSSAYGFDGIDLQRLLRGTQPTYNYQLGVFGSEVDSIYTLAHDERTQTPVATLIHFGMPGHRCTWSFPKTELVFQNDPLGQAGALNSSVIQLEGTAFKNVTAAPFNAEAYTAQTVAYLIP